MAAAAQPPHRDRLANYCRSPSLASPRRPERSRPGERGCHPTRPRQAPWIRPEVASTVMVILSARCNRQRDLERYRAVCVRSCYPGALRVAGPKVPACWRSLTALPLDVGTAASQPSYSETLLPSRTQKLHKLGGHLCGGGWSTGDWQSRPRGIEG